MGAIALRNSATIGGNIGNASPKGDMPQPLILMDAEVVLTSVDGERRMLVDDYIIATKKTALREDEIITKVIIPKQDFTHTFFRKIGMRRANAISKLTLSAAATVRDGVVVDFRASSGAAGPKVARSRKAEELLIGKKVSELSDRIVSYPQILKNVRDNVKHAYEPADRRYRNNRRVNAVVKRVAVRDSCFCGRNPRAIGWQSIFTRSGRRNFSPSEKSENQPRD